MRAERHQDRHIKSRPVSITALTGIEVSGPTTLWGMPGGTFSTECQPTLGTRGRLQHTGKSLEEAGGRGWD